MARCVSLCSQGTPGHLHRQVTSAAGSVSGDVQPPMGIDLIVKQYIFPINRDMYVSIYIYTYISVFPCCTADLSKVSMMMVTLFP